MKPPIPYYCRTNGSLFIVTLVVSIGLVSLALYFGHSMMMAYRGTDNQLAGRQADLAIEGAARYAEYLLSHEETPGMFPELDGYQCEAVPIGDARFWFIGVSSKSDSGLGGTVDQPVFGLVDEASKLNLNYATMNMLQQLPGMTPELANAIVEWRRSGTNAVSSGFSISSAPTKNGPFESVWELALVSGSSQELLYGHDTNFNHVLDPQESGFKENTLTLNRLPHGLLEYVTVFSREPNTKSDGKARINVAAPWSKPLEDLLSQTLGDSNRVQQIKTQVYNDPRRLPRSVLEFYVRCSKEPIKLTETELEKLTPSLTGTTGNYGYGLVNVNTASESVLACIEGIGDKAAQLVAARQNRTSPSTNLAWVVPILTEAGAVLAGRYLTTRSYQITADVAAVGHHGRGYRRTQFIIDSSSGTPRILYRRNLSSLGWALGAVAGAPLDLQ